MKQSNINNGLLDLDTFQMDWQSASETEQLAMVTKAAETTPGQGIIPILSGIDSYHRSIRNRSKQGLALLRKKVALLHKELGTTPDTEKRLFSIKESSFFSSTVYRMLKSDITVNETKLFISVLLNAGDRGPFYAWKFFQRSEVSVFLLRSVLDSLSESKKLVLVDQYLISDASIRRKFAAEFKRVLKSISNIDAVTRFFAYRFSMNRDMDPFLNHIDPGLRDSAPLKEAGLNTSLDPSKRIESLKALAMVVPEIESSLLLHLITTQKDETILETVFSIVEKSGKGSNPELVEPIMDSLDGLDKSIALSAFRAMVRSALVPLSRLIDTIRNKADRLMPEILAEISCLSGSYFLSVLDLITDNRLYRTINQDLFKALMIGVIQKRPERVLKLLSFHENHPDDLVRQWTNGLAIKINRYLAEEKKQIGSLAKQLLDEQAIEENKEKKGFLQQVFSMSVDKKIATLKESNFTGHVDFKKELLENLDLTSEVFYARALFNESIVRDSNLSQSSFVNFLFNKTVFHNVNLDGSTFESISFNQAIFINVTAKNSQFINCSFREATFVNTDFDSAVMTDAVFTGAIISRCSFTKTDLSGSTFAAAKITATSFVESTLFQTDFTGIQAKFSRFSSRSVSMDNIDHADFNARSFQLIETDMPDWLFPRDLSEDPLFQEIKLLILTEFIGHGKDLFLRKNKFSILTTLDGLKPKQTHLFEMIPLLLHEDMEFPGYGVQPDIAPHGIPGYLPSRSTRQMAARYSVKPKPVTSEATSFINGLFIAGDTGSIAQSRNTTIHYHIILHGEDPDPVMNSFHKKLHQLKLWAQAAFKTDIAFTLIQPEQIKKNSLDLPSLSSWTSGQPTLNKANFYRTMTHLAGKLPLWSILPSGSCGVFYETLAPRLCSGKVASQFIDLGDIHHVPANVYFSQSVRHLFAGLDKPFESMVTLSLLDRFVQKDRSARLLCNQFKDNWMAAGFQAGLKEMDPCHALITGLVNFYKKGKKPDAAQLIIFCFFLKLGISTKKELQNSLFGFKEMFIRDCMKAWSWNPAMIFETGGYDQWPYERAKKFSLTLEKHMVNTYRKIHRFLDTVQDPDLKVTPDNRNLLGRKILVQFSKQAGKVEKILPISGKNRYFESFGLNYEKQMNEPAKWEIIEWSGKIVRGETQVLKRAATLEVLGAWLVHNRLLSEQPLIHLVPNTTPITLNDVKELLSALQSFFIPDVEDNPMEPLLVKPEIVSLFLSLNLSSARAEKAITECSAVYVNSWGEMFYRSLSKKEGYASLEDLLEAVKRLIGIDTLPEHVKIHRPKSVQLQLKR